MNNFTVTLAGLREAGACYSGYNKLVRGLQGKKFTDDDKNRESYIRFIHKELINIIFIAENNGIDDALWSLACVKNADRDLRLYAVWCARQVEYLMTNERSKNALNVAERHANGLTYNDELAAARDAARAAAWDVPWDAARDAARAAAWDVPWDAARDAARAAARDAARAAARAAARDAARDAAAWDAAWDAARAAQKKMLIKMCNGEAPWQKGEK